MPIIIKDYTWRETETTICIRVPLHGIPKSRVDLLTTDFYMKASFEQFFFEVFLLHEINLTDSLCVLHEALITYELLKKEPVIWGQLERVLSKQEKREIKEAAFEVHQKINKELEDAKASRKDTLRRCAITESVCIDTARRKKIEGIRETEKLEALGDITAWHNTKKPQLAIELDEVEEPVVKEVDFEKKLQQLRRFQSRRVVVKQVDPHTSVPLPRTSQILDVEFTARSLPTPSRESRLPEEEEWLSKQAAARRTAGFVSEDLRPEERNPQYLLAKGDEFLKNDNLLGALSAYSYGLEVSPNFVDFHIKRAEAHFRIGNFNKCVTDCSSALDLMQPPVPANHLQRGICIGRRGEALHKLGLKRQALDELRLAVRMVPNVCDFEEYLRTALDEPDEPNETEEKETKCG